MRVLGNSEFPLGRLTNQQREKIVVVCAGDGSRRPLPTEGVRNFIHSWTNMFPPSPNLEEYLAHQGKRVCESPDILASNTPIFISGARFLQAIGHFVVGDELYYDPKVLDRLNQLDTGLWENKVEQVFKDNPYLRQLLNDSLQALTYTRYYLNRAALLGSGAVILAVQESQKNLLWDSCWEMEQQGELPDLQQQYEHLASLYSLPDQAP